MYTASPHSMSRHTFSLRSFSRRPDSHPLLNALRPLLWFSLLCTSVAAQFQLSYPDTVIACQPNNISWTGGSGLFAFFTHTAIGGVINDNAIEIYRDIIDSHWVWNGDLQAGLAIKFQVTDATGASEWTPIFVLAPGLTTDCMPATTVAASLLVTGTSPPVEKTSGPTTTGSQIPTSNSNSDSAGGNHASSSKIGAIVGGVVGGLALLLAALVTVLIRSRKRRAKADDAWKAHPFIDEHSGLPRESDPFAKHPKRNINDGTVASLPITQHQSPSSGVGSPLVTSTTSSPIGPEMLEIWRREIREEVRREMGQRQSTSENLSEYRVGESPPEYMQRESTTQDSIENVRQSMHSRS